MEPLQVEEAVPRRRRQKLKTGIATFLFGLVTFILFLVLNGFNVRAAVQGVCQALRSRQQFAINTAWNGTIPVKEWTRD